MSEEMKFDDELQALMRADPFVSFSLLLTSGDRYNVLDPGMALILKDVLIVVQPKSGLATFRRDHIIGVELPARSSKKRRGRRA